MHLSRKNSKAVAESHLPFTSIDSYVRFIVDLYSAVEIKRELWLTEREKDFFVATVIHVLQGCDNPISDEALQIYKDYFYFKTTKSKISDYLNRICKKNWAKYDKKNRVVQIPPIFSGIGPDEDMMDFKLRFSYEADRSDMDEDGPSGDDRPFRGTHALIAEFNGGAGAAQ